MCHCNLFADLVESVGDHVSLPDKPGGRGGGARVALQTSSSVVGGEHVQSEVWAGSKPFWVGVGGETEWFGRRILNLWKPSTKGEE
jgi:hypothetical protein